MEQFSINHRLAVVQPASLKKPLLVRLKYHKHTLSGIIQNNSIAVEPDVIELSANDILCIFSNDNPQPGQVYKCKIEPFFQAKKAEKWGTIFFYRNLSEAELRNLLKTLTLVYKRFIKPNNLNYLLPITLEIKPNEGIKQGYYRRNKKTDEHAICLCPTSFIEGGHKNLQQLLVHELGHPIHSIYMPDEIKERWVSLYVSYNVLRELTLDDLDQAHSDFITARQLPSEYRKKLDEEPKIVFNAILKYIKNAYHLKIDHLDLLVGQKNSNLRKYWPKSKLQLSEMQTPISKYAGKAPVELWCEALSFYAVNNDVPSGDLPKEVKKLIVKTLKSLIPK